MNCANRGETNAPDGTLAYHAEAIYPSDAAWASSIADRLTDWGFTTIGGWSDWELLGRLPDTRFIHTPVLHVGSAAGAPWRDLWNPQWTAVMEEQARAHIKTSDARVMGRYSDNELGWWNGALFRETLDHLSTSGQRQRLVALLREMYENDWSRLLGDFEPVKINSFEDLEQAGQVYLRPGGRGIDAYRRFLAIMST